MSKKKPVEPEIQARRDAVACLDYSPVADTAKCEHYAGRGACARPDRFMCEEWERKNPKLVDGARAAVVDAAPPKPEPAPGADRGKHLRVLASPPPAPAAPAAPRRPPAPKVHQLDTSLMPTDGEGRHILKNPELLTVESVASLAKSGFEITAKLSGGTEITLVPAPTEQDRAELTYADARTLLMVLQVFPGATLDSLRKAPKETG